MCNAEHQRPKPTIVANSVLSDIHGSLRRLNEERRRISMESEIYKQYRLSDREDAILHDSRSDHEAMAKMNWLDKQVSSHKLLYKYIVIFVHSFLIQVMLQMEREREKRTAEERALRLHEESRKQREHMDERRSKRKDEIADLKQFQESHLTKLNSYNKDSETLRQTESYLRHSLAAIEQEQRLIQRNLVQRTERSKGLGPFNVRRIKLALRNRSEAICSDLREDAAILDRLDINASSKEIAGLRDTFQAKHADEKQRQLLVEAMYESEAKQMLATQERAWSEEEASRAKRLTHIVDGHLKTVQDALDTNLNKQRELVRIKETHLNAIQMTNDRLKDLMVDQRKDEVDQRYDNRTQVADYRKETLPPSATTDGCIVDALRRFSVSSTSSLSSELSAPKYGRKKLAWT